MSNEIKNTLFRFVSMRAPELTTEHDKSLGFITQPIAANGIFNAAIDTKPEGMTKLERLQETAAGYVPYSVDQIKSLNQSLYDFSVWLAKNKSKATTVEIADKSQGATALIDEDLVTVWQNLYYQIITQKDFYAKETLMQLLFANHIVQNYPKINKALLKAKVVLPKKLFVEDETNVEPNQTMLRKSSEETKVGLASPFMQKMQQVAILKENNQLLRKLQRELQQAEKVYRKKYAAEYEKQQEAYQLEIKPLLDTYYKDVESARTQWCAIKDPAISYDANDPCHRPPSVPEPVLPKFKFVFEEEMDETFLSEQLSEESLTLLNLLKKPTENIAEKGTQMQRFGLVELTVSPDFDNYSGAQTGISQLIEHNDGNISQITPQDTNTTVVVGGTTVTVTENESVLQDFQFEAATRIKGTTFPVKVLTLSIGIPDSSWNANTINYKLTRYDDTFVTSSSSIVTNSVRNTTFINMSMEGIDTDFKELSATVQFNNNEVMNLVVTDFEMDKSHFGWLSQSNLGGGGDTNPGGSVNPINSFIPSGFGVKQLGIADYNKVEQSIQGYVEGEVAHIENVMAREYKEKATRRLRKSEITETTSSETEREQLTDTSTTDRFEMQSEVAKVIANSKDFSGGVGVNYRPTNKLEISANANFATHNSKEESTRQAMTSAKEVTERALDRIVNKVKEERIVKIVEEFEENNSHGFDNRKGDKHVVGVYRWVDKVFKNQILNYGKRLMFEFMVPEPAKLHKLAMEKLVTDKTAMTLEQPDDPRKATGVNKLENYDDLTDTNMKYWSGRYNVELEQKPDEFAYFGKSIAIEKQNDGRESVSKSDSIKINEGYVAKFSKIIISGHEDTDGGQPHVISALVGNKSVSTTTRLKGILNDNPDFVAIDNFKEEVPISIQYYNYHTGTVNVSVKCEILPEVKTKWKQQTFNAIIKAYEDALAVYNEQLAEKQALGVQILGTNPGFYREIENTILRKNCISYLIDQNITAKRTYGKDFHHINGTGGSKQTFENTEVRLGADLDDYAAFVKFIEQAFEWEIMSYNFYPYYWANRQKWVEMYQYDQTHDHIFKAFMQSGMARVIVTVRPGFEDAVRYYMQTGQIWNGGEVPVIEDELYLSIVDELRLPEGEKVGKAWWTRIPTSMTILQAQSIGLNVTKALPFNTDLEDFEDPDSVPQSSEIDFNHAQIGGSPTGTARLLGIITGSNGISSKIMLKRIDGSVQNITYCDANGNWELNNLPAGRYELLLDAENDFPADTYQVTKGSKELMVELQDDQTVEINLTVALL